MQSAKEKLIIEARKVADFLEQRSPHYSAARGDNRQLPAFQWAPALRALAQPLRNACDEAEKET